MSPLARSSRTASRAPRTAAELAEAVSDVALVEAALREDPTAWERIVARHKRRVFNIAFKFTARHDQAEDLSQEIFLRVFRSLGRFNQDANFATWLSSVARNYCIDHYRSRRREREVISPDAAVLDFAADTRINPQQELEEDDRRSILRDGLERLPPKLREAVILRDLRELTYQEMATTLRLPEGTVKSRINRGREELRRMLLRVNRPKRRRERER